MSELERVKDKKKSKILLWVIVVNVVLWTTLAILLVTSQKSPEYTPEYLSYVMAKRVVSDKLKSPSTAKFQPYDESIVKTNGELYQVTLWVDAENSFGAKIRSKFIVMIKYDGKNYALQSIQELR